MSTYAQSKPVWNKKDSFIKNPLLKSMNENRLENKMPNRKFIAPVPQISKSTTFERKFKSIYAQREAEYDKNLKSIKCNLFDKFNNVSNASNRENLSQPPRMNKFKFLDHNDKRNSLVMRDRSRSITKPRVNMMKTTPNKNSFCITEKSSEMNFSEEKENIQDILIYTNKSVELTQKDFSKIEENINKTNLKIRNSEKFEEEIKINLEVISDKQINLTINNSLDVIINNDDDFLCGDDKSLLEIYMKDELIFSQKDFSTRERTSMDVSSERYIEKTSIIASKSLKYETMNYNIFQETLNKINLGFFTSNYENLKLNKEFCAKFSRSEYRKLITTSLRYEYGRSILEEYHNTEEVNINCLSNHEITERMRVKMIDWMIEVLSNYNCCDSSYFLSVNIMDRYFKNCNRTLKPEDLHLIGICSMFISSKFYDIHPLKLKTVVEKVSHNKYTPDEIKQMEENIVKTLDYKLLVPTLWDFTNFFYEEIFFFLENNFMITDETLSEYIKQMLLNSEIKLDFIYYDKFKSTKKFNSEFLSLLKNVSLYLAKMNCHDYFLMAKPSLLAASTLFVGLKICEQINNEEYINEYFFNRLVDISRHNEYDILSQSQRILSNAQNFDSLFPGLENLKRVHIKHILEMPEDN